MHWAHTALLLLLRLSVELLLGISITENNVAIVCKPNCTRSTFSNDMNLSHKSNGHILQCIHFEWRNFKTAFWICLGNWIVRTAMTSCNGMMYKIDRNAKASWTRVNWAIRFALWHWIKSKGKKLDSYKQNGTMKMTVFVRKKYAWNRMDIDRNFREYFCERRLACIFATHTHTHCFRPANA